MVSWPEESASFRNLVTGRAGAAFVLCAVASAVALSATLRGVVKPEGTTSLVMVGGLILAIPFAYVLPRDLLVWVVTRPAIVGLTVIFIAGSTAGLAGYSGTAYLEESTLGLFGIGGGALLFTAIPAAVAVAAVMAVHGAGGRSSGPDGFPEE